MRGLSFAGSRSKLGSSMAVRKHRAWLLACARARAACVPRLGTLSPCTVAHNTHTSGSYGTSTRSRRRRCALVVSGCVTRRRPLGALSIFHFCFFNSPVVRVLSPPVLYAKTWSRAASRTSETESGDGCEMVRKKSCPSPQALRHKTLEVGVVCPCVNSSASPDHCTRALQVACKSKCPSSRWQDVIASQLVQSRMVFVNVGANKGYRVAEFLSRFWSGGSVSSNKAWRQELIAVGGKKLHRPCGICSDCMAPPPRSRHNTTVEVHALDVSASIPRHRPPRSPIACCPSRSCSSPT